MGKGTNFISELSAFFEKNNSNRTKSSILGMMKSIRISEKSIGLNKMYNCKMTSWQVLNCAVGGAVEFSVTEKIWEILLKAIFAVADKLSVYAPDVLKAIIDEDEDMVRLMNLNVKLRMAS